MYKKKIHYFYKITNKINGHFYYGIHSTNDINDGYMGSGRKLKIAIKKYGIENFSKEILSFFTTRKEASIFESEMVTEELVKDKKCYNVSLGGKGNSFLGKISAKDKYDNIFLVSTNDKRLENGELTVFWEGKHHKKETVIKMKESFKRINHQKGEKNSQFGTCWVTKNNENKKIALEKLDKYLSDGWNKGRNTSEKINYDYEKIKKHREEGLSKYKIAQMLGIKYQTFVDFCKRNNL